MSYSDESGSNKGENSPMMDAHYAQDMGSPYNRSQDALISDGEDQESPFNFGHSSGLYRTDEFPQKTYNIDCFDVFTQPFNKQGAAKD